MEPIKVLFADDDTLLGNVISEALRESGFEPYYVSSLVAITSIIREFAPDIIVLDVEVGKKNSIDALDEIRNAVPDIPVLFVSSHHESYLSIRAIEKGGLAYLRKPFEIEELIAYIRRFTQKQQPVNQIQFKDFTLDLYHKRLKKGEEVILSLSPFECKMLTLLFSRPGQVISKEELMRALWGAAQPNLFSLNNYIRRLRLKLAAYPQIRIRTHHKRGIELIDPIS